MELPNIIVTVVALVAITLYLREYFKNRNNAKLQQRINEETKQKAAQLLAAATQIESKIISEGSFTTQKLTEELKSHLDQLLNSSQHSITISQDQLIKFMEDLQKRSVEFEQASRSSTQNRISQTFERLESKLSDFLIQAEQKTTSSIELELKSTRELIETYKNQQLRLIDENIIAMMEKTLSIVLAKKLSLKDQLDLVYEALERAKVEKFIV